MLVEEEAQVRGTDGQKWGDRLLPLGQAMLAPLTSTCEYMCVYMGPCVFTHTYTHTLCDFSVTQFPSLSTSVLVTLSPSVALVSDLLAHIVPLLPPPTHLSMLSPTADTHTRALGV